MAIACAGYGITSQTGHHRVSLLSAPLALGKPAQKYADYFDTCRCKRNHVDCTFSNVATWTEANEITLQAAKFYECVEAWISKNYPTMKKQRTVRYRLAAGRDTNSSRDGGL